MGVQVDEGGGGGGRKTVDIDMNLIPFIDLMSCLVAFLLVTAVWTNLAQINIKPKGIGKDPEQVLPTEPPINISVLVASDSHWVGLTTGDRRQIKKTGEEYDWQALNDVLNDYKNNSGIFKDRQDIELAAEDGVHYQAIISTMDSSIAKGFPDLGYVDPNSLSVRFKQ
jgi:biopolymer transport protein ExbD